MSTDKLTLAEFSGTPTECGVAYGREFETAILGFCRQEMKPDRKRLAYAKRCWPHIERSAPTSASFLRGMARGSHLNLELLTLLTLHEEVVHQKNCTALAATREVTGGPTIIGQNWDWSPHLYYWAGLQRLSMRGSPRMVTYHYPGLWACAGINEHGLALLWTGGGYLPHVPPVVGLPTYVLLAELLRQRSVNDALAYLHGVKHAGCFIFFLGDATGATAVVEAIPGRLAIDQSGAALCRANHYTDPQVLKAGQQTKPSRTKYTTAQRGERMAELLTKHHGRLTPEAAKAILTDRTGDWPWLHQYPAGRDAIALTGMTIDSLFAVCEERTLWTCRGGRVPGPWQSVTV